MRRYVDGEGREWDVWMVVPESRFFVDRRAQDPRRTGPPAAPSEDRREVNDRRQGDIMRGWLCFSSGSERRRLHPVPRDWEACSPERLDLMRRVAKPVPKPMLPFLMDPPEPSP